LLICLGFGQISEKDRPFVPSKRRAVVIGIGDYTKLAKLTYPKSDAEKFRSRLVEVLKFDSKEITMLVEKNDKQSIEASFESAVNDPSLLSGDLFVVYFSGHGIGTSEGDFLCPVDFDPQKPVTTGISIDKLLRSIVNSKLRNVLIIADACRAGEKNTFGSQLVELGRKSNIAVLLGCEPGTKSYESDQLSSGVFTYFLNRSLEAAKVRRTSGALTSSDIASYLSRVVKEYTEPKYGVAAQVPTSWTDPTKEVFLGVFPESIKQGSFLESVKSEWKQLDNKKLGDLCFQLFNQFYQQGKVDESVELLKLIENLDPENELARLNLANVLHILGRRGESDRLYRELSQSKTNYIADLATLQSTSTLIDSGSRLKAAKRIWKNSDRSDEIIWTIWYSLRAFGSMRDLGEMVQIMTESRESNDRVTEVLLGDLSTMQGKTNQAIGHFKRALTLPPTKELPNFFVRTTFAELLNNLDQTDELKKIVEDGLQDPDYLNFWKVQASIYLRSLNERERAVQLAKEAIKDPMMNGLNASAAVRGAGVACGDLSEDLKKLSDTKPYDWKLKIAYLISKLIKDQKQDEFLIAFSDLRKFVDDDIELAIHSYDLMNEIFQDAKENFDAPASISNDLYNLTYRSLTGSIADFRGRDHIWQTLAFLGMSVGEGPRTADIFKASLRKDAVLNSSLMQHWFLLANSAEDVEQMRWILSSPNLFPQDRNDIGWGFAMYLLASGRKEEAEKLIPTLAADVSFKTQPIRLAVLAGQRYLNGEKLALDAIAKDKGDRVVHAIAREFAAILYAKANDWDKAGPLLGDSSPGGRILLPALGAIAAKLKVQYLVSQKMNNEANQIVYEAAQTSLGQPTLSQLKYAGVEGLKSYEVNMVGKAMWVSDDLFDQKDPTHTLQFDMFGAGNADIQWNVSALGAFTGNLQIEKGIKWEFKGQIDEFGILTANAKHSGGQAVLIGKLIPRVAIQSMKGTVQQFFSIRLPDHRQILIVVKLKD
jgi:tetratricopeptide (TPR) repeat protein